ncbi:MAG TPA: phospholipase D-like domain-containing protein, partial [Bacteroidia bacterium]|nr:phospholipase D-like domain-containing protein [Bacteroidia bacterium]
YKFGVSGARIITPIFSHADSLQFWMKGASVDALSFLTILYTVNSFRWDTLAKIIPISNSGTNMNFHVPDTAVQLQFTFTKSVGNLAFDDFLLTRDTALPQIKGGAISNIRVYFNHKVDTSVSVGVNAVFLDGTLTDTLVAYISRANYSIDITQYDYTAYAADKLSAIATAINAAYSRGVKIRWIYNGSSSNRGLRLLDTNIATLASPTGGPYNIMHDKFVVIDAHASDSLVPIVWTGSADWSSEQMDSDYNNIIIFQNQKLALAYTAEFNQMWGDSTSLPDTLTSKFGPFKTDLGPHLFNVGGVLVELYFSPSDSTNSHILQSIASANTDLYFGVYTFTETSDANAIANKFTSGVYSAGIIDQYSTSFSAYPILNSTLGNNLKVYADNNTIYHNKYLIVDASNFCSDPQVLTGSHNWSTSADVQNDENTVIVHSDTIANIYYQAFSADFTSLGGVLTRIPNCVVTGQEKSMLEPSPLIYPNPNSGKFMIDGINSPSIITVYNELGAAVKSYIVRNTISEQLNISDLPNGIYLIRIISDKGIFTGQSKMIKIGE